MTQLVILALLAGLGLAGVAFAGRLAPRPPAGGNGGGNGGGTDPPRFTPASPGPFGDAGLQAAGGEAIGAETISVRVEPFGSS